MTERDSFTVQIGEHELVVKSDPAVPPDVVVLEHPAPLIDEETAAKIERDRILYGTGFGRIVNGRIVHIPALEMVVTQNDKPQGFYLPRDHVLPRRQP